MAVPMLAPKGKWKDETNLTPPLRSKEDGYGTIGRKISLITNHFPVSVKNSDITLYHYDVTIKDIQGKEEFPKKKKMAVFERMKESFPEQFKDPLAYDSGKSAYGVGLIPALKNKQPINFQVIMKIEDGSRGAAPDDKKNRRNKYSVTLKLVTDASLRDLLDSFKWGGCTKDNSSAIQMCEVMFRHYRACKYAQIAGRNFFGLNEEFGRSFHIGGGKEGVVGFFASLRPAAWKEGTFTLNIDTAHTAYYTEQSVIDFLKNNMGNVDDRSLGQLFNPRQKKDAEHHLKGLRIRVTHANVKRPYKVLGLTEKGADTLTFDIEENGSIKKSTVEKYLRDRYRTFLKYPSVNCLHVGNPNKKIYLPLEVCQIDKGQKVQKKLDDRETAKFIEMTAIPPADRLNRIMEIARKNNFKDDLMLKSLTFTVEDVPIKTEGRVLPPPDLIMQTTTSFKPIQGSWDLRNKRLHQGASLNSWAIINYDFRTSMEQVNDFKDLLVREGRKLGMTINEPVDIYESEPYNPGLPSEHLRYYKEQNPKMQLVFCVLPHTKAYGDVKKAGDRECSLVTQCVLSKNVCKCHPVTASNILLKINAKMGGINCIVVSDETDLIKFSENSPVIILGADVNHPPPGDNTVPSFAAVVGSIDLNATKYAQEVRAQEQGKEIIVDMTEIVINLLKAFYYHNGKRKPERIIMYRDGVSESQFAAVLAEEMMKIREACKKIQKDYTPGITYICVQKRHHTRFFCENPGRDGTGKFKNVPPGTVVDRDVTHPTQTDFFLCSHQGIQGTSRPAHYHVLWDDSDIPMNELQMLTYKLCHVFARCTKSVSLPTPAYYAHLAAFRAKVHTSGTGFEELTLADYQAMAKVAWGSNALADVLYYV